MLGGINYKNGVISTCPRQGDQLVFQKDAYLPSDVFNHENFKKAREQLYNDIFPKGCKLCEEMEDIGAQSLRKDFIINKDNNTIDQVVACCDCKAVYIKTHNTMSYCIKKMAFR